MLLNDIAMIAADTSRSRAYAQALERADLVPRFVLLLEHKANNLLPGQVDTSRAESNADSIEHEEESWRAVHFDPTMPIKTVLERCHIPHAISPSTDINDPSVVEAISRRSESVFIYSGFGGALLKEGVLATGKRFLHVHGGYLPDYKGSTTNYYSLLAEDTLGASSLFLSAEIDGGPVLVRRKFSPPPDRQDIDHVYDSAARARVLIETLQAYVKNGSWQFELAENREGETYYIIHPVLKHIAVLATGGEK